VTREVHERSQGAGRVPSKSVWGRMGEGTGSGKCR
jgi:hypothetical protein